MIDEKKQTNVNEKRKTSLKCCCFFFQNESPSSTKTVGSLGSNSVIVSQPKAEWNVTQHNTITGIPRRDSITEFDMKQNPNHYRKFTKPIDSPRTHKSSKIVEGSSMERERFLTPSV